MRICVPALAALSLISGFCWAGTGVASAASGVPASGASSATVLALSPSAVVYGDEQAEQFTVTVSGPGGTPAGTVTVSAGATTVCTIILAGGTGACSPGASEFAVGSVSLTAAYGGDGSFDPSASATASLQVDSPPPATPAVTTTTLSLSRASITYRDESAERISVTVAVPGRSGDIPAGSVTVSAGGASVCEFSLSSSGTGSCGLKAATLPPGTARLAASYAGDTGFASSVSAAGSLSVTRDPTVTTVSLSAGTVTYGAEQRERVSVAVKPAYGGTATGHVTIKAGGATIRVITLTSGQAAFALAAASLPGGTAELTAIYAADPDDAGSTSTARKLAVARASSSTTLGLSAGTVTYGAEQHARIRVAVRLAHAGTANGRVTVKAANATICVITLRSARGTCALAAARRAAGRYRVTATYGGSGDVISSAAAARSLSITRASSRTALSLSVAKVRYGSEGSAKISVRIAAQYAGTPQGMVSVRANGAALAVIRLKSGQGRYTLSAKRLAAGTYTLTATYRASADFRGSISVKRSLTVASPPPPPPACYPLTSGGNCYEPGEYCPERDHGLTGIAGDGEAIICADNNGWRWEPLNTAGSPVPSFQAMYLARASAAGAPSPFMP